MSISYENGMIPAKRNLTKVDLNQGEGGMTLRMLPGFVSSSGVSWKRALAIKPPITVRGNVTTAHRKMRKQTVLKGKAAVEPYAQAMLFKTSQTATTGILS
jgi:hypothetical protein